MQAWYQWGGSASSLYTYRASIPPAAALTLGSVTPAGGTAVTAPVVPGSAAQAWLAVPSADGHTTYRPVENTGWCLDVTDTSPGATVTAAPCDGSVSQDFAWAPLTGPDGFPYRQYLSYADPDLCLAQSAGAVSVAQCADVTGQMWWSL
jgi:hypothetical protein